MDIRTILETFRHIAVIGISDRPNRPSNGVARFLIDAGYTVYPVNPKLDMVLDLQCYPSLLAIPEEIRRNIEIVDIFRKSADVPPVVDEAIAIGAKVVWMQLGITNEAAAAKARKAGLEVVQDHCTAIEVQNILH